MSPSSGGRNCSLAWNVSFPISRLQMSEKIYVAYAQQRHASNFYLCFLETWSSLELTRPFSINAVPSLSWPSSVQAEELRLRSLSLLCFQSQKEFEKEPFPPGLPWAIGFDWRKCQIMPNAPKCWVHNISSRTSNIINTHNMDTSVTGLSFCGDDATLMACISHQMIVDISHVESLLRK